MREKGVKMDVIVFAFKGNISEEVLNRLNIENKQVVNSNKESIIRFVNTIILEKPSHIIGLGMCNLRGPDKLRIETECSDSFRRRIGNKKHKIGAVLREGDNSKFTKNIGSSYCNLISYQFMEAIVESNFDTSYSFIHIPKKFNVDLAVDEINHLLKNIKM